MLVSLWESIDQTGEWIGSKRANTLKQRAFKSISPAIARLVMAAKASAKLAKSASHDAASLSLDKRFEFEKTSAWCIVQSTAVKLAVNWS